ncbi:hypothetical protein VTJ83DRAFT_5671 [Remersonia thermophila]|uniref:Uncharacterized protein n=1 Tax=Remersonia thermophila TaxID=72144 RepID=A0ABR4D7H7_9PEZI
MPTHSASSSPALSAAAASASGSPMDESRMPKGHCRYILLNSEIKGLRCACVGFSLNRDIPSATCQCGHLACFHNKESDVPPDQRQEIELLRRRLQHLEDQLAWAHEDVLDGVVSRLNQVEDHLEKSREEVGEQIKGAYRNVSVSWQSIQQAERRTREHDEQLRRIFAKLRDHDERLDRVHASQQELRDADLSLEERIENLTEMLEDQQQQLDEQEEELRLSVATTMAARPARRRSTSDTFSPNTQQQQQQQSQPQQTIRPLGPGAVRPPAFACRSPSGGPDNTTNPSISRDLGDGTGRGGRRTVPSTALTTTTTTTTMTNSPATTAPRPQYHLSPRLHPPPPAPPTGAWTVHISLLPHAYVPMPFERNTTAYQRCLSRGLHKMVAVQGRSAEAFKTAVERAFGQFLRGREWMPLQAKLCDAATLQGLPMLRQLDEELMAMRHKGTGWDHEFLRRYCAVVDTNGVIDSLYIAMQKHTISWHTLRHSPVFMEGLEACWAFDPLLDKDPFDDADMAVDDEERPAAGDITTALKPPLKRTVAEMSRSNSFGGGTGPSGSAAGTVADAAEDQARVKRACPPPPQGAIVEIRRRDIKTA